MRIKDGFTLIELLGVVILLGVIALIATPVVRDAIDASKEELYEEQIEQIEDGLKNWAHANVFLLPEENSTIKLSLGQLAQAGHVNKEIRNPKNNKCFSNSSTLKITKYNNSYVYEIERLIDIDCKLITDSPTIKLNGDVVEYLNIGDTYTESGASAKGTNGADISSSITTTISGSGTSINTLALGTYYIRYSVTSDGKTMTAIRTIIIK